MDPEEHKHAADRRDHELRGNPSVGIMSEVVGGGMRLERREARRRVLMALLAGLQQVGWSHARRRIAGAPDRVAAVAVGTGRAIGKTQGDDLAMIGLRVTLRGLGMASDAVLGDGEPCAVPISGRLCHVVMGQLGYCLLYTSRAHET